MHLIEPQVLESVSGKSITRLQDVQPVHVAAYIALSQRKTKQSYGRSTLWFSSKRRGAI
jgi:hypothetical protein